MSVTGAHQIQQQGKGDRQCLLRRGAVMNMPNRIGQFQLVFLVAEFGQMSDIFINGFRDDLKKQLFRFARGLEHIQR